jgi:hypothetical protein
MNATAWWAGWSIIVIISLSTPTQAQEKIDRQSESHQAILNYLGSLKSVRLGKRVQLQPLGDDDLRTIFNQCEFFLLRYPRYPSEVIPVEPLRPNNLFAVCDRNVSHMSDGTELRDFFLQHFPSATNNEIRTAGIRGWLRLAQELYQDGFVKFSSPSIKTDDSKFEGAVNAIEGTGEGSITVKMLFRSDKLAELRFEEHVVPGPRQLR